jgi:hypothetical protein
MPDPALAAAEAAAAAALVRTPLRGPTAKAFVLPGGGRRAKGTALDLTGGRASASWLVRTSVRGIGPGVGFVFVTACGRDATVLVPEGFAALSVEGLQPVSVTPSNTAPTSNVPASCLQRKIARPVRCPALAAFWTLSLILGVSPLLLSVFNQRIKVFFDLGNP